jgi:uridine phosphorylase
MKGIGSPHAATILEELISLGGKEFLNIGLAGGLDTFGIYLCEAAIRDEGTSHHYLPQGKYSYPDSKLTQRLARCLKKNRIEFTRGITWTIDAPYRETKTEIAHYKKEGVKTVEMEASALFAVAKMRKVKIASAFAVSDIVGGEAWDPQFQAKHVVQNVNKLFDVGVECLSKKG